MFNHLQPRIGFGWATRVIAFIMLGTLIISLTVMKVRVQPAQTRRLLELSALKEAPYSLFTLGIFFGFSGLYIPFFYAQSYALSTGIMEESLAQYLFAILNAGSIFGRIIPNYIADRIGPFNVLIPSTFAACLLAFSWLAIKQSVGLFVFSALYGFFTGSFVSLPPTAIFSVSPNPRMFGTRLGMNFALGGLGILIGTPVAGHLISMTGYSAAIAFCGAMVAAGAFSFVFARTAKCGFKFWVFA
jgi:predicted MFS family arabinose efflux permease